MQDLKRRLSDPQSSGCHSFSQFDCQKTGVSASQCQSNTRNSNKGVSTKPISLSMYAATKALCKCKLDLLAMD